jgi:hypothetical protein
MATDDPAAPGPSSVPGVIRDRALAARRQEVRERVIAKLSEEFAQDTMDVEEFERRVTLAHTSGSAADIESLIADLPPDEVALTPAAAPAATALARAPASIEHRTMYAIMSGIDRRGPWTMPSRLRVVAMMGGAHLDLRDARFPPGPVDLEIKAFMGGVQIIVPPGLAVQMHGAAIMGGFTEINRAPETPDPDAPLLRVHGFVMMGGVDVQMRLPGESDRDAARRQRRELRGERKAQRRLDRAGRD